MTSRKIKLRLNKKQRELFRKWIGVYRWTYNKCVRAFNSGLVTFVGPMATRYILRELYVNASAWELDGREWISQVPYDIRDGAVTEFVKNVHTELKKAWAHPGQHRFNMSFKSRFDASISIPVLKKHWNKGVWFKRSSASRIRGWEEMPERLRSDARMTKTKYNDFYLCVSDEIPEPMAYEPQGSAIALDPGVRTFMTGYDPSGKVYEIGQQDAGKIFQMCKKVDIIMSKSTRAKNHKQRYNLKRAAARVRESIKNKIKDLHCKTAKFLCQNYETIYLPVFATKQMVRKAQRKINSKTARMMLTFSHYTFRQIMLHKARFFSNVRIHIVNESYTSKTCTRCGVINDRLGGSKVFRCRSCGLCIDRDINGARNILIRSVEATCTQVAFEACPPAQEL